MKMPIREVVGRALTFPVGAAITALTSWVILNKMGVAVFAEFSEILGVIACLAFLDFGGAANAVGVSGSYSKTRDLRKFEFDLSRIIKLQLLLTIVFFILSLLLAPLFYQAGFLLWLLIFCVYLASQPLAIISKVLVGLGKSQIWYLFNLAGLSVGLLLVLWIGESLMTGLIVAIPLVIAIFPSVACSIVAMRITGASWKRLIADVFNKENNSMLGSTLASQRHLAGIALFTSGAFASDRALLSQLGDASQMTNFSLTSQVFNSGFALLSAAGLGIWGYFASSNETMHSGLGTRLFSGYWVFLSRLVYYS